VALVVVATELYTLLVQEIQVTQTLAVVAVMVMQVVMVALEL
jgi:hypothetical protein